MLPPAPPRPSPNAALADTLVTALEGRFRDWLMSGEHAEAKQLVAEILDREMDTLAEYTATHGRREWWDGNTWIYPGDRIVILSAKPPRI
jgi:hypothetical protein